MQLLRPASREEWLEIRKHYVSSTESAALFGQSPYITAFELGVIKRDGAGDEDYSTERMKWGTRLQHAIAKGVGDDYGIEIVDMNLVYAGDEADGMGSSFDYQIKDIKPGAHPANDLIEMFNRLGPGLLEIKNVDGLEYKNKWSDGEAPDHIEIQLQHQLETLGLAWGCIAALVGGNRVGIIIRERDKKVGSIIRKRIRAFWDDFRAGKLPDPTMPDDAAVIIALYKYADPNKVWNGAEQNPGQVLQLKGLVDSYKDVAARITDLEEQKKIAKAAILQIIGDSEKAVVSPGVSISAAMRAPTEIAAYTRAGYRDFRVNVKKEKK